MNLTEYEEAGKALTIDKVLTLALKTPGIRVDREAFLMANFGQDPRLKEMRPIDIFDETVLDKRARAVAKNHTTAATAMSAAAGIPGGMALLPAAVADIVQYYSNTLIVVQKLGYIYGWPDLRDKQGEFDEDTIHALMVYLGVAMGVHAANKLIQELAEAAGKAAAGQVASAAVTKTIWYPILKKIMAAFDKQLTKELAEQIAKKAVPVLGAVISGSLTLGTFSKANKRLIKALKEEQIFSKSLSDHYVFSTIK